MVKALHPAASSAAIPSEAPFLIYGANLNDLPMVVVVGFQLLLLER
jgi:hypothetical protein